MHGNGEDLVYSLSPLDYMQFPVSQIWKLDILEPSRNLQTIAALSNWLLACYMQTRVKPGAALFCSLCNLVRKVIPQCQSVAGFVYY